MSSTTAEAPRTQVESLRSKDRAGNRWYRYPPTGEKFISVTAALSDTEGRRYLIPWSAKRAAVRCVDQLPLITSMLARKGRDATLEYLAQDAERDRDLKADAGTYVHDVVEALILWAASPAGTGADIVLPLLPDHLAGVEYDDQPVEAVTGWMVEGFLNFTKAWQPVFEAAEMAVFHPGLQCAGTLDIIVTITGYAIDHAAGRLVTCPGNVLVICLDVKTGKHESVTWREQVAVYRRMAECLLPMGQMAPMPRSDCAAVLRLRPDYPGFFKVMLVSGADDEAAWETFQGALTVFRRRHAASAKPGKVVYPAGPDGKIPPPLLADLYGERRGRTLSPLMKAGIHDLGELAGMTAEQCDDLDGVGPKTVVSIRRLLAEHGLHLAGEAA